MNSSDFLQPFFMLLALFAILIRVPRIRDFLAKDWGDVPTDWNFVFILCTTTIVCLDTTGIQGALGIVSMVLLLIFLVRLMARAHASEALLEEVAAESRDDA